MHGQDGGGRTARHACEATGSLTGVRGRNGLTVALMVAALITAVSACDTGDGRELRDPTVPYVPPTEPTESP